MLIAIRIYCHMEIYESIPRAVLRRVNREKRGVHDMLAASVLKTALHFRQRFSRSRAWPLDARCWTSRVGCNPQKLARA